MKFIPRNDDSNDPIAEQADQGQQPQPSYEG